MGTAARERSGSARAYGARRLRNKTARQAIIHAIGRDFNLTPLIAEAYFSQISTYFGEHANVELHTGQVCYEAVSAHEPAGKHIALASRVSVRLTLFDPQVEQQCHQHHGGGDDEEAEGDEQPAEGHHARHGPHRGVQAVLSDRLEAEAHLSGVLRESLLDALDARRLRRPQSQ